MSEADDDIELEDVFEQFRDGMQNELHTAFPARVLRYDAGKQVCSVRPMVRRAMPTPSGALAHETLPDIHAVPVAWLGAGPWVVHAPLAEGHEVLVICSERDFARWMQTAEPGDAVDARSHSLSFAMAIPGIRSRPHALQNLPTDALLIGKVDGAHAVFKNDGSIDICSTPANLHYPALANLVSNELTALKTAINGAATAAGDGGATFKAQLLAALVAWPGSVAASKTRVE